MAAPGPYGPRDVAAYDYDLPDALVAREPAAQRDGSRLLVVARDGAPEHRTFAEFPSLLRAGDVLVINETRVIRARLRARRDGGGAAEVLLLRPHGGAVFDLQAREWIALVRPGRKLRPGARLRIGDAGATITGMLADGPRTLRFDEGVDLEALLERHGEVPLPPYVAPQRGPEGGDDPRSARYQTVFARVPGSVAAPTASLHFTPEVLDAVRARGVVLTPLVLDVGIGTFRPMSGTTIDEHVMHAERYAIRPDTAAAVRQAHRDGRRVIAAGTTVLRALEGAALRDGTVHGGDGETDLFVTPGFRFRVVDALLTNFHLPRSTLLVLVAAFAGYARTREAYRAAIDAGYRFFSFGDAMFVEREEAARAPNTR
ncbi:tRNA preQ1(34) S-adenosylmethionine ribosyltransferase-isomerase QueA [Vulcanimicrobium alpinum]|uniref:tRNA preQ1(34) S-adenosylmethionine ribosyltransferase-isomerase QueA n=1 Tax=Vulcanimicrobium alpinum TaxID=3016050 RepID=UPI00386FFC26